MNQRPVNARGFALFELVIVTAIIGIVAAIAIPRVSHMAAGSRDAALQASVKTVTQSIDIYSAEHEGRTPAHNASFQPTTDSAAFEERLTEQTNEVGSAGGGDAIYGPYLRAMPVNPYNGLATVRIGGAKAGAGTHGWWFSPVRNVFLPDDSVESAAAVFDSQWSHLEAARGLIVATVLDGGKVRKGGTLTMSQAMTVPDGGDVGDLVIGGK